MSSPHSISTWGLRGRRALRRFLYSQMALRTGAMVALGKEQPIVRFTVAEDPPSVYIVFRITDVEAFERHLALPNGIRLAPIRCLVDDEPEYLLTLNAYRVSGITNGLRVEWSCYIADTDGVPRYMVVDARSDNTSMDPVDVITKKSRVEYERRGTTLSMHIGDAPSEFTASFEVPDDASRAVSHPEWVTANDFIYWRNGVCDRTFYDAGMADADQAAVDPESVIFADNTEWARFVESSPVRVLVVRNAIELIVSPWANIDELS